MNLVLLLTTIMFSTMSTEDFLDWYWRRPLASQGQPPSHLSTLERSLHPQQCGVCHPRQFVGWQKSRHAQAMGAGVIGQLLNLSSAESQECLNCHAPLQEQAMSWTTHLPDHLSQQGVLCGACHVRNYQWFGPPPRAPLSSSQQAHSRWQTQNAFTDSRFCAACHQFPKEGYTLNGKLLENTYQEWQNSPSAQQQKSCQSCHMPDRQHLWRGIHDVEMVRSGVTIRLSDLLFTKNMLHISLVLQNTHTGHFFPTYVTPKVVMQIYQEDETGHLITETLQEVVIAREVSLDLDREYFDTRLAPNEVASLKYCQIRHVEAKNLVVNIQVYPDAFYTRFYQNLLAGGKLTTEAISFIKKALLESEQSKLSLYYKRLILPFSG